MKRIPLFGWKATKLADHSFEDLNELRERVTSDSANANPEHTAGRSIYLYTREARRKLDALAWAVTYKLAELKAQRASAE